jgi:hypothetical protein
VGDLGGWGLSCWEMYGCMVGFSCVRFYVRCFFIVEKCLPSFEIFALVGSISNDLGAVCYF